MSVSFQDARLVVYNSPIVRQMADERLLREVSGCRPANMRCLSNSISAGLDLGDASEYELSDRQRFPICPVGQTCIEGQTTVNFKIGSGPMCRSSGYIGVVCFFLSESKRLAAETPQIGPFGNDLRPKH